MHFTTAFVLAAASSYAAAQSSTSTSAATTSAAAAGASSSAGSTSGCGTQIDTIINDCLATENAQLNQCATTDWDCLCTQSNNVLTCYNNCPSDPNAFGARQKKTSYCDAAAAYPSSSSTSAGSHSSTSAVAASTMSASSTAASVQSGFATASASGSAAASSSSSAAVGLTPAGSLFAALFGLALL